MKFNIINERFLRNIFGKVYTSLHNVQELVFNYEYLLEEKKKLLEKIDGYLNSNSSTRIILEDWEIDLLLLQDTPIIYERNEETINFKNYYSLYELDLIKLLKKISVSPESISEKELERLYDFIRNRSKVEKTIEKSGNGLSLDIQTLDKLIFLIKRRVVTNGKNINIYERLCKKLNLTKEYNYSLEYKIS